jgi:hypothetical protein
MAERRDMILVRYYGGDLLTPQGQLDDPSPITATPLTPRQAPVLPVDSAFVDSAVAPVRPSPDSGGATVPPPPPVPPEAPDSLPID